MSPYSLGKTLIIANPTAHSGRGEGAAIYAMRFFSSFTSATSTCEVRLTESKGDATRMAALAGDYETVLALGGDGVVNEVVNGLMSIEPSGRPRLGILPMGSGNDFARTLGMRKNDPEAAIEQLLQGEERSIDLGKVNGSYFVQTLSFGLDAAIALDTTKRRERYSRITGSLLFITSGIKLIVTSMRGWPYLMQVDGKTIEGTEIICAVQNGPTYGGGFRICPQAVPNDGMLDLCYAHIKPNLPHSLALFGLARFGMHKRSHVLNLSRMRHAELEFFGEDRVPCQIDGESLEADRYVIDVVPRALSVIVAPGCGW